MRVATVNGIPYNLTNAEYAVLVSFIRKDENLNQTLTRLIDTYGGTWQDALLEAVYNFGYKV